MGVSLSVNFSFFFLFSILQVMRKEHILPQIMCVLFSLGLLYFRVVLTF